MRSIAGMKAWLHKTPGLLSKKRHGFSIRKGSTRMCDPVDMNPRRPLLSYFALLTSGFWLLESWAFSGPSLLFTSCHSFLRRELRLLWCLGPAYQPLLTRSLFEHIIPPTRRVGRAEEREKKRNRDWRSICWLSWEAFGYRMSRISQVSTPWQTPGDLPRHPNTRVLNRTLLGLFSPDL